jgi:thioredoxin reductase (NADPH)
MSDSIIDVIIVGAGPAGIQAAIHAARKKTSVLMLGRIENSALYGAHIENYACIAGITDGRDLLESGLSQVQQFGAKTLPEDILKIEKQDQLFAVKLESGNTMTCRSIIFSMGVSKKKLNVPGEKELSGQGVSYCVDCDANFYRGATVVVAGNRSAAVDGALTLLGYADKVYLVAKKLSVSSELMQRLKQSDVEVLESNWIQEIHGKNSVKSITMQDGSTLNIDGIFIELGSKGALELATQIDVALDTEHFKYINTNRKQETNIPGIYAAGDIVGPPYQMAKAVGEGCVAGIEAATYVRRQKKTQ